MVFRHGVWGLLEVLLRRSRRQQEQLSHERHVRRGVRGAGWKGRVPVTKGADAIHTEVFIQINVLIRYSSS